MQNAYVVGTGRYQKIRSSIVHPVNKTRNLYFCADSPNLLKNIHSGFRNIKLIIIPQSIVQKNKLHSSFAMYDHIYDIRNSDKADKDLTELRLFQSHPKRKDFHLGRNHQYVTMRVQNSTIGEF